PGQLDADAAAGVAAAVGRRAAPVFHREPDQHGAHAQYDDGAEQQHEQQQPVDLAGETGGAGEQANAVHGRLRTRAATTSTSPGPAARPGSAPAPAPG